MLSVRVYTWHGTQLACAWRASRSTRLALRSVANCSDYVSLPAHAANTLGTLCHPPTSMNPGRGAEDVTLSPPPPMPPTSPQAVVSSEDTRSGWRAHTKAVTAAAAAKGGRLLTTSTDGQVKLWVVGQCSGGDAASSPWEEQILDGPHASVNAALLCCALSYNGETACVGDAYGALHCWDLAGPHPVRPGTDVVALRQQRAAATVRRFSFRCHPLPLTDLAIDGEEAEDFRIITASEDGTLVQWALPTPQAREAVPQPVARFVGHKAPVRACVLLPVGGNLKWGGKSKLLASGGDDGTCRLWDCHSTSCMLVVTVCSAMSAAVCALAVSSCGKHSRTHSAAQLRAKHSVLSSCT
jgi:WD40 repeat protein